VKTDKEKVHIAMARSCISVKGIAEAARMPIPTVKNVVNGNRSVRPETIGRVAKVLQVDVTDILADEKEEEA